MLPIDLRHYRIQLGKSHTIKKDDVPVDLYVIVNRVTDVQEYEDLDLASTVERGLGMDKNVERAIQYVQRKLPKMEHLEGVDIDEEADSMNSALEGMLLPPGVGGNGGPTLQ